MNIRPLTLIVTLLAGSFGLVDAADISTRSPAELEQVQTYQRLVQEMKAESRGPFLRLRWFCNDGSILPPKAYACVERGGGRQHGEWSDDTKELRDAGYLIGNVLAAADAESVAKNYSPLGVLQAILVEKFLIDTDDGWILRKARFYRGAFQGEDERRVAAEIIDHLTANGSPIAEHYLLIMEATKHLPGNNADQQLQTSIRNSASSINKAYPDFTNLRNKIHGRLDATDAARVRDFAANNQQSDQYESMLTLADSIDRLFSVDGVAEVLTPLAEGTDAEVAELAKNTLNASDDYERLQLLGQLAAALRKTIELKSDNRAAGFTTVAKLEQAQFAIGSVLIQQGLSTLSRAQLMQLLLGSQDMLYAVGLLTDPEQQQANVTIRSALSSNNKLLADYQDTLSRLARVPVWSERRVQFFFEEQVKRFADIEPLAVEFVPDRLRGSPLFFYSAVLKVLTADAARLGGVQHQYFGQQISDGLRPLNPGIARGVLHTPESLAALELAPEEVILVVPETLADLPPVSGLLTAFEGNQLSHVQLLARNLGVPNVVVSRELLTSLGEQQGQYVELLASKGGVVSIAVAEPEPADAAISVEQSDGDVLIKVDETKLDLTQTLALTTRELSTSSSGVTVGPKAAKVAELSKLFPQQTSPGLAIPFGTFRKMLDENQHSSGQTMFSWIRNSYQQLASLEGTEQAEFRQTFLTELRNWFLTVELDAEFIQDLTTKMSAEFGPDGSYGVFVRSDTNVEDLPGFTGAGLNLTVPHVVGVDKIIESVRRVWASPFTERAFGWRQARMDKPEHVYTAILLHKSVAAEKSGVFVTTDVFDGQDDKISVVLNEGVAGGVDGLSAESLRIDRSTASVERMASATAPYKRVLLDSGGSASVPTSGSAVLLSADNVRALLDFSANVGSWFSNEPDAIADVEFAFYKDKFVPLQIRPLVDPPSGKPEVRLQEMDEALLKSAATDVDFLRLPLNQSN